jgi:hypothetical protein
MMGFMVVLACEPGFPLATLGAGMLWWLIIQALV